MLAVLALNGVMWAIIVPVIRGKGTRQVEKYGSVPGAYAAEPAEFEGRAAYLGTLVDGRKYFAPGYWVRGSGPVRLTKNALHMLRGNIEAPVMVLREGIRKVERRSRFAGRGTIGERFTVIHWEMGGGQFQTGFSFSGGEDGRLDWERRLKGELS